ncbi:MAG TPA: cobalamin-binding protein [Chloroflexi bacterium]|nr:cobalamin-binding protein [Chloroflexota bacterium]
MSDILKTIYSAVVSGDRDTVQAKVQEALEANLDPLTILNEGMVAAMGEVGDRFERQEFFVPEMLIAARAMQTGMAILKPHLMQSDIQSSGRVLAGTVLGDVHDIGKNLVCTMLEGAGFEIHDLGVNVAPETFVKAVQELEPDIVAMSALLTTTMPNMRATIEALESAGLRAQVRIMVGGAPVTESFAQQIGADGYAPDASQAVRLAKSLVEG